MTASSFSAWKIALLASALVLAGLGISLALGSSNSQIQGDLDCDGDITSRDNQALLRNVLGQNPLSQVEPCTNIGDELVVDGGSTPSPGGLSRDNPVAMGQKFVVPEGWEVTIVSFDADATQEVLDENQFNDPPAPGKRFSIVRVRVKNISAGNPGDPDVGFAFRMVGSQQIGYSTFENSCGVIPDDFDFKSNDIFEGGTLEGNICYETANGEASFAIYTQYLFSDDEATRWFEVN